MVREGYDSIGEVSLDRRPTSELEADLTDRFRDRLPSEPRVLDVGCGSGLPVTERLTRDADVVAVDISGEQLEIASRNVPDAAFSQQDVTDLGIRSESVDGVCALYSIIHAPDHETALREFYRVLRPGGVLFLSIGATQYRGVKPNWFGSDEQMVLNVPDSETGNELLDAVGFEVLSEHTHANDPESEDPVYLLATKRPE